MQIVHKTLIKYGIDLTWTKYNEINPMGLLIKISCFFTSSSHTVFKFWLRRIINYLSLHVFSFIFRSITSFQIEISFKYNMILSLWHCFFLTRRFKIDIIRTFRNQIDRPFFVHEYFLSMSFSDKQVPEFWFVCHWHFWFSKFLRWSLWNYFILHESMCILSSNSVVSAMIV